MDVFQAVVLIVAIGLPFHLVARRELARMCDRRRIAASGLVAECEALEARSDVIGHYDGRDIYAWVQFLGMRFYFDRIVPGSYREEVRSKELFLEPGLVYRIDSCPSQ